jgi:hypothetical protein
MVGLDGALRWLLQREKSPSYSSASDVQPVAADACVAAPTSTPPREAGDLSLPAATSVVIAVVVVFPWSRDRHTARRTD